MGKGDKKSRKGKIAMGSYGVSRPRKASGNAFVPKSSKTKKATLQTEVTEAAEAPKTAAAKKTTTAKAKVAKAPKAEKAPAKTEKKAPAKKAAIKKAAK